MTWPLRDKTCIVGIGQTHHKSRRWDVSLGGLVREAARRALDDAEMDWDDIDAVVLGKAPDLFEGVMKPELYLTDALGAVGKPMFRVHTAGSVGGSTGIVAASHVQAGKHRRVLAVAFEKQSEGNAQFALGSGKGASLGAGVDTPARRATTPTCRCSRVGRAWARTPLRCSICSPATARRRSGTRSSSRRACRPATSAAGCATASSSPTSCWPWR